MKTRGEFLEKFLQEIEEGSDAESKRYTKKYLNFLYNLYRDTDWDSGNAISKIMNTEYYYEDNLVSVTDKMTILRIHLYLQSPARSTCSSKDSKFKRHFSESEYESDAITAITSEEEELEESEEEEDVDSEKEDSEKEDSEKEDSENEEDSEKEDSEKEEDSEREEDSLAKMRSILEVQKRLNQRMDDLDKMYPEYSKKNLPKKVPQYPRTSLEEHKRIYNVLEGQNRISTTKIKSLEETFVQEQQEIDRVRFSNDKDRYLKYRYQIHNIYDSLTRNVYLMCKIKKGEDITADMEYFFPVNDRVSDYHDNILFGHREQTDEIESPIRNRRDQTDSPKRFTTFQSEDVDKNSVSSERRRRVKPQPKKRMDISKKNNTEKSRNNRQNLKKHFKALKFSELHKKYDDEEFHFFQNMDDGHQQLIYQMEKFFALCNQEEIPIRFRVMLKELPLASKASIVQKIEDIQRQRMMGNGDHKYQHWLHGLLKIPFGKYQELPVSKEDGHSEVYNYLTGVKSTLDKAVYGHMETKQQIIQLIAQWVSNPTSMGNVIGIQGPMGNGKTTLVRYGIAEALKRPFHFISLGGASDSSYLDGHSYTYEGSTWGRIVEVLIQSDCMNPVFYFDELDKVSKTHRGEEIMNLLIHLTDPTQNNKFQDKYFSGIDIDLSRSVFIFSYNDKSAVNPILLDRLYTVKTEGFKTSDKICIVNDYLLPSLLKTQGLESSQVEFSEDMIEHVIAEYTDEEGVRGLKKHISNLLSYVNILLLTGKTDLLPEKLKNLAIDTSPPVKITREIIEAVLNKDGEDESMSNLYL